MWEVHVHVLDDPVGLSPIARAFLRRAGVRRRHPELTNAVVLDRRGRPVDMPGELASGREAFVARYGGLCLDVRRSYRFGVEQRRVVVRRWRFDLLDTVRRERTGWTFQWYGEHVASPVSYFVHTDGRFGVRAGNQFIEAASSIHQLIEGQALMDEVSDWEPVPFSSLETWVPSPPAAHLRQLLDTLPAVPEASGRYDRWWRTEDVAIRLFRGWTTRPDATGVMIWCRDGVDPMIGHQIRST